MAAPAPRPRSEQQRMLLWVGLAVLGVWLLVTRGVVTEESAIFFAVLIPSVIVHEVSHGVVALLFGDDTAKREGRLSLNPVRHVDPVGTLLLPAVMVLTTGRAFGYAKPVPVNVRRLRNPRNHSLLVSLAGPAVNIVIAVAAAYILRPMLRDTTFDLSRTETVLLQLGVVNVILAAFNLIPLPPLDGSALVERFLPARWWGGWLRFRQHSMAILLIVVLLLPSLLERLFDEACELWVKLL